MAEHKLLQDRTIVITGAATGIGQAFALASCAHGANVVVADIGPADETVQLVQQAGGQALYVQTDVSDAASVDRMAQQAVDRFGRIDGLINNAAYFREVKLTDFEQIDPVVWDRIFAVNVKGVWHCCKAVMPAMRRQGSGAKAGRELIVGSLLPVSDGRVPVPTGAGLGATPNLLALQRYRTWPSHA